MSTNANINTAFCRHLLAQLAPEVKAINPKLNVWRGAEWVYKVGRDHWEFHGPDQFYWHGSADGAFDARYKGWSAWLEFQKNNGGNSALAKADAIALTPPSLILEAPALLQLVQEVLRAGNANTRAIKRAMGVTWARTAREVVARATASRKAVQS